MKNYIISLCLIAVLSFSSSASHLVGGELTYKLLPGNKIQITLVIYADCFNGIPGFDMPAYVSLFDTAGNRLRDYELNSPVVTSMLKVDSTDYSQVDSCVDTNYYSNIYACYDKGTYTLIDTFIPTPGGGHLVYDRCCLNAQVINVNNALQVGFSLTSFIPDTSLVHQVNSSPNFKNDPAIYLCQQNEFNLDLSGADADGDSLFYEWISPYASTQISNSERAPIGIPELTIQYAPNFSLNYPLSQYFPIDFDSLTGTLKGIPCIIGYFFYGVRIHEYRNGVYLGYMERVFQFLTLPSQFPDTSISCGIITSIASKEASKIEVYPNPTSGKISINTGEFSADNSIIKLYSIQGKIMKEWSVNSNQISLDISDLPGGLYLLRLTQGARVVTIHVLKS